MTVPSDETVVVIASREDELEVAVPARLVARVETIGAFVAVPGAPSYVTGIAEVRGRIVTVLDGRVCTGRCGKGEPPRAVAILTPPWEHLALALDERLDRTRVARRWNGDGDALIDENRLRALLAGNAPAGIRP